MFKIALIGVYMHYILNSSTIMSKGPEVRRERSGGSTTQLEVSENAVPEGKYL